MVNQFNKSQSPSNIRSSQLNYPNNIINSPNNNNNISNNTINNLSTSIISNNSSNNTSIYHPSNNYNYNNNNNINLNHNNQNHNSIINTINGNNANVDNIEFKNTNHHLSSLSSRHSRGDELVSLIDKKKLKTSNNGPSVHLDTTRNNDLSLLMPTVNLANNSQKKINSFSAGLLPEEDSEFLTDDVKNMIVEQCNIIYECKECNNLFRSLANLVKHKKTYCTSPAKERNNFERNKRSYLSYLLTTPTKSVTKTSQNQMKQQHQQEPIHEEMIRNSSLAKSLLSEEVKTPYTTPSATTTTTTTTATSIAIPTTQLTSPSKNALQSNQIQLKHHQQDPIHEELIKNSSLAKSLLNEEVKTPPTPPSTTSTTTSTATSSITTPVSQSTSPNKIVTQTSQDQLDDNPQESVQEELIINSPIAKSPHSDEVETPSSTPSMSPTTSTTTTTSTMTIPTTQLTTTPPVSSAPTTVSSAGSTTSSSGLMKLKITLKTRPDEKKSKVYEIV